MSSGAGERALLQSNRVCKRGETPYATIVWVHTCSFDLHLIGSGAGANAGACYTGAGAAGVAAVFVRTRVRPASRLRQAVPPGVEPHIDRAGRFHRSGVTACPCESERAGRLDGASRAVDA